MSVPVRLPKGFRGAGAAAGIKASGKPDLALIVGEGGLSWALASTTNALKAPFVIRNRQRCEEGEEVRAVAINSGNANCAAQGDVAANEAFVAAVAKRLGVASQEVLTLSTGVIGHTLPVDKIEAALPNLAPSGEVDPIAAAILTTDLVSKVAEVELKGGARVVGIAKGSGMIHPNMATMLAFVLTDANVPQVLLREMWAEVVNQSFNQVTVDGDTSPNDTAMVLSSRQTPADLEEVRGALLSVCQDLAKQIARDGEGATKLLTVHVSGAKDETEARRAARAVVLSPLVKAAAHGNDPNWGRILSSVGATGVALDLAKLSVRVQGQEVYCGGAQPFDAEAVSHKMDAPDLFIEVDLGVGVGAGTAWGCDLSADYVRINADYHT